MRRATSPGPFGISAAVAAVFLCAAPLALSAQPAAPSHPSSPSGPAYLLIELPSRRVVAESRPDVLVTPVAPGSIIKVATLIAAMEQGVVDASTHITCRRSVTVDGQTLTCAHPDLHRPMSPAEALGFSCNVYFATIAQRLPRMALDGVLTRMGLNPVERGASTVLAALGLAGICATPRMMLEAFINVTGRTPSVRMSERTRAVVLEGLRLAASTGTAAAFGSAGISALAKTGTAPMPGGGFHRLLVATIPDVNPTHAIVVLIPGGAGVDAAAIAVDVLRKANIGSGARDVRVGVIRRQGGYDVVSIPLETYVSRVIAGEMSSGASQAALEALAITVRTYAEANRRRHQTEGFDLCDLTHCQVLGQATADTDRATRATAGLVLRAGDSLASVFFSAWCGGYTEVPSRAWDGAADPAYLPAKPDEACAGEAPWSSEVAQPQLLRALHAAGLHGTQVSGFSVAGRDSSGRVTVLRADGMAPDRINANVLLRATGTTLGWQVIKSTLFDVKRTAVGYAFAGRGLGHGVGLCVRGAMAKAAQGQSRNEILAAYFPGLAVGPLAGAPESKMGSDPIYRASRMGSDPIFEGEVRVLLPESERQQLADVRALAQRAAVAVAARLGVDRPGVIEIEFYPTIEAFTRATKQPWWTAGRTSGTRIGLLPLEVLRKRGTLELTVRHELVHVMADSALRDRPLWVREGLAAVIAGETDATALTPGSGSKPTCPTDAELRTPASADAWRRAYNAAGRCVARDLAAGTRWQALR